jgi:uncharacterized protein (DUF58 family)
MATSTAAASFLDPVVLSRIGNLELVARTVVDGFVNGLHRAPFFGLSLDFAEHRGYQPGDDIRRIDWRLFARTDRFHVKEFEADTNSNFMVLLDASRSMGYSSGGVSKLDYARFLAASLAYFSHGQRDRVGIATLDDQVRDFVPCSAKHLNVLLHTLDRLEAGGGSGLQDPLLRLADRLRRRGFVVLISDLYEEPERVVQALTPLRAEGHDVIVFHVLDPAELEFPFDQAASFVDAETGDQLPVVPAALRAQYREMIAAHSRELSRVLRESRMDYVLLNTAQPLDVALFHYLTSRERLSRVR